MSDMVYYTCGRPIAIKGLNSWTKIKKDERFISSHQNLKNKSRRSGFGVF